MDKACLGQIIWLYNSYFSYLPFHTLISVIIYLCTLVHTIFSLGCPITKTQKPRMQCRTAHPGKQIGKFIEQLGHDFVIKHNRINEILFVVSSDKEIQYDNNMNIILIMISYHNYIYSKLDNSIWCFGDTTFMLLYVLIIVHHHRLSSEEPYEEHDKDDMRLRWSDVEAE